eukprot:Nk52_evm20s1401 gene=Nk52_evmTU20s1401
MSAERKFLAWLQQELAGSKIDEVYAEPILNYLKELLPNPEISLPSFSEVEKESARAAVFDVLLSSCDVGNELSGELSKSIIKQWLESLEFQFQNGQVEGFEDIDQMFNGLTDISGVHRDSQGSVGKSMGNIFGAPITDQSKSSIFASGFSGTPFGFPKAKNEEIPFQEGFVGKAELYNNESSAQFGHKGSFVLGNQKSEGGNLFGEKLHSSNDSVPYSQEGACTPSNSFSPVNGSGYPVLYSNPIQTRGKEVENGDGSQYQDVGGVDNQLSEYDSGYENETIDSEASKLKVMQNFFAHYSSDFLKAALDKVDGDIERAAALIMVAEDTNNYGFSALEKFDKKTEPPKTTKKPVCRYFLEGGCYRANCWYSHEIETAVCKFWIQGCCFKGDECPFRHSYDFEGSSSPGEEEAEKAVESGPVEWTASDFPGLDDMKPSPVNENLSSLQHDETNDIMSLGEKIKLIELKNMFYKLEPYEVEKAFDQSEYSFENTVALLNSMYPGITVRHASNPQPHIPVGPSYAPREDPEENSPGWVETGDVVNKMYQDLRDEAADHAVRRNKFFQLAVEAYMRQDGASAKELARHGRYHDEMMRMIHSKASYEIFLKRNSTGNQSSNTIDLHGLHVEEALEILDYYVNNTYHYTLYIITGSGNHSSDGKAKLLPAVERYLENYPGCEYEDVSPDKKGGMIKATFID